MKDDCFFRAFEIEAGRELVTLEECYRTSDTAKYFGNCID